MMGHFRNKTRSWRQESSLFFFSDSRAMVLNLDHILDSEKNYFFADLFLAVLDPCCCVGFFLAVVSGDSSLVWASD